MKIKVTQEHIDKGKPQTVTLCPIALAATEQIGYDCFVGGVLNIMFNKHITKVVQLPFAARHFVAFFDLGLKVEPFEFEIDYEKR